MAMPIDVVRKIIEMVEAGRLTADICDGMLEGLELTTLKGTGVFEKGMLRVDNSIVTLDLGTLSKVEKRN